MSHPTRAIPPRLLTIAGSDSGGGAGIQADLKTFAAHGAYGMSAIAAITAQNTREVRAVAVLEPDLLRAQIAAVVEDLGVDAVKIGMLANAELVAAVAQALRPLAAAGTPIVLDPVMVAKSGAVLLDPAAVRALVSELVPLATVVTPNLPELGELTGLAVASEADRVAAARALIDRVRPHRGGGGSSRGGAPAILAKGGHAAGEEVVDLLLEGDLVHRFAHPRIASRSTHGTGCTLSSAIAARLGRGEDLATAVAGAIAYLEAAIAAAPDLGGGHGPVEHFHRLHAVAHGEGFA